MGLLTHFIHHTCQSYFWHSKQTLLLKPCTTSHICAVLRQCLWLCVVPSAVPQLNARSVQNNVAQSHQPWTHRKTLFYPCSPTPTCQRTTWAFQPKLGLAWLDLVTLFSSKNVWPLQLLFSVKLFPILPNLPPSHPQNFGYVILIVYLKHLVSLWETNPHLFKHTASLYVLHIFYQFYLSSCIYNLARSYWKSYWITLD